MSIGVLPGLKIHHVSIAVPDMEAALSWYADILGFQEEFRFFIDVLSAQGAFIVREGLRIELWAVKDAGRVPEVRREPNTDLHAGGTKHAAFLVPDLQGRLAELVKRGVDIAAVQRHPSEPMAKDPDPLAPGKPPAFAAFIRDPCGTLIELLDEERVAQHG
jgi:catechol 2,3-dioxygenase-like lactoylglutathione lyase family enzyme